ncbi:MAG: hypothetical protein HOL04_01220 [Gammaproteobacteria bacterium]|jgi:hypothetical protein|nr:hypothetical protein [Gammaproteobacteria bacterium]MBT4606260.1 hypothetical protein [Thiotrichales bacterium]MBT3471191.1 hypothetical protein [Gammaproteobacteria bacterium]MBT3968613.1 hypothetical protein [Gammaproteobacteria bacterium]MBT4080312.1 hypothetical protein [Gammaproteobacteria bacterium]
MMNSKTGWLAAIGLFWIVATLSKKDLKNLGSYFSKIGKVKILPLSNPKDLV